MHTLNVIKNHKRILKVHDPYLQRCTARIFFRISQFTVPMKKESNNFHFKTQIK